MMYAAYFMHDRPDDHCNICRGGRLYQEWLVDQYCKIEAQRLLWVKLNQTAIRAELYQGLQDAVREGDVQEGTTAEMQGRNIVLPSSFTGGQRWAPPAAAPCLPLQRLICFVAHNTHTAHHTAPRRYMAQSYQDAMALVRTFGKPDLFITMTCNPKWEEIARELKPGETPNDRPDLISRVFRIKKDALLDELQNKGIFGRAVACVHVIEFQKRGLPHAHILLILAHEDKPRTAEDIDRMVSARPADALAITPPVPARCGTAS